MNLIWKIVLKAEIYLYFLHIILKVFFLPQKELRRRNEKKEGNITSYAEYGKGENIEVFFDKQYNMIKHGDLKPEDRKLPKDWKKKKWEAPEDPFDPLKDLFKKKK